MHFYNKILRLFHLPLIDEIKLCQGITCRKISKLVPNSIKNLIGYGEWHTDELLNENTPIYVMWWTGEKTMPALVKICYNNLYKKSKNHPIVFITKDNVLLLFPSIAKQIESVCELYENGSIRIQHLSDIIRTFILDYYGGIWIDATVFVTDDWDKDLIGRRFYSGRRTEKFANSGKSVTNGQWTSYFIASVKGNPLIRLFHEGLIECYNSAGEIKEYYTMDYLFAIAMRTSENIRNMVVSVPEIDCNLFALEDLMQKAYLSSSYDSFMKTAPFFKLNHRINYLSIDSNGNLTVYGYLQSMLKL